MAAELEVAAAKEASVLCARTITSGREPEAENIQFASPPPDSVNKVVSPIDLQTLTSPGGTDLQTLTLNLQTLTSSDGQEPTQSFLKSHQSSFLKPLSFPEVPTRDLAHFLDPKRDTPIQCLMPTCKETFGVDIHTQTNTEKITVTTLDGVNTHVGADIDEVNAHIGDDTNTVNTEGVEYQSNSELTDETSVREKRFCPKDEWLRHMFLVHKMVIDKVNEICSLKSYSRYWRERFCQSPLTEFVAVIRTNSTKDDSCDPPSDYYLLSQVLPEDRELREQLKKKKLEAVLLVQKGEREENCFSRSCLFCNHVFNGNRSLLFQHMLSVHSFNVGQPDNLVFVKEFLDLLKQKLDNLQCLYCERSFRDHSTLRDHMRKKQHKKINPKNHEYDRFYLINYLEIGKTWEEVQAEDDREILQQVEDSDWSDWKENEVENLIFCLFCSSSFECFPSLCDHMTSSHEFDYREVCRRFRLDYYRQVKLVNYIRRKFHMHTCCFCHARCHSHQELTQHMRNLGHYSIPHDRSIWDQSQYYFPTFENDALLSAIEDTS